MAASLIDHLQEQGYEPQEDDGGEYRTDRYDLTVSGTGTVRVCIHPGDENSAVVHLFDQYMVEDWSASLTPGTPDAVIIVIIEAAEWELAAKRGGPVTPAQASNPPRTGATRK